MSSKLHIGGATLLGIGIILGALYVQNAQKNMVVAQGAIVTAAPDRQPIASTDADGDGIEDWRAGLTDKIFESTHLDTDAKIILSAPNLVQIFCGEQFFAQCVA